MPYIVVLAVVALLLMIVVKILNLQSTAECPRVVFGDVKFADAISRHCPNISDVYYPTMLWGLSGHIQSVVHAVLGRVKTKNRQSVRRCCRLADGATLTWDEWTPLDSHPDGGDYTLAICPGIGNSSETVYIWSFVHYACLHGYRCVVLNHLGALRSVRLTSPRIFNLGRTDEFDTMLREHVARYPFTKLLLVGFSLGGNIVTKYMGQQASARIPALLGAISICQGYDALRCLRSTHLFSHLRRCYMMILAENMKKVILRHRATLLSESIRHKHQLDERKICVSSSLLELDEAYSRRVGGYRSVDEYYRDSSSAHYIANINKPMIFINAKDDPLIPPDVLTLVSQHCSIRRQMMLIETAHGGHLGFFQGGFIVPDAVTWLDKTVVQLAHGLVAVTTAVNKFN